MLKFSGEFNLGSYRSVIICTSSSFIGFYSPGSDLHLLLFFGSPIYLDMVGLLGVGVAQSV
jgi:hypothetical protein